MTFKNLDELFIAMRCGSNDTLGIDGLMSIDLPVFGGDEPTHTLGVWSWDAERVIVGDLPGELEIISRAEWEDACDSFRCL